MVRELFVILFILSTCPMAALSGEDKSALFQSCVACVNALVQGPCYARVAEMAGWGLCLSCDKDGGVKPEDRFLDKKRCPDCDKVSWSLSDFKPAPSGCVSKCSQASDPARKTKRSSRPVAQTDCSGYQPRLDACSRDRQACETAKAQGLDAADCGAQYQNCLSAAKKEFAACQAGAVLEISPQLVRIKPEQQTRIIDLVSFNNAVNQLGANGMVEVDISNKDKVVSLRLGVATGLDGVRRYTADGVHYYTDIAEWTNPAKKQRLRRWLGDMRESLWASSFRPAAERTLADSVAENALHDLNEQAKDKTHQASLIKWLKGKAKSEALPGMNASAVDAAGFAVDSITTMFTEITSQRFRQTFKAYARLRAGGRDPDSIYDDGQDPLGEQIALLRIGNDNPLANKKVLLTVLETTFQRYELARTEFGRTP